MKIDKDKVVAMSYSITDKDGRLIEARTPENPVQFIVGHGQILPVLETSLLGFSEGYKGDFVFLPEDAHGEYKKELVVEMARDQFPSDVEIKKGMKFESSDPDGKPIALHILDITNDKVLVDGNHPLAGEELRFKITILTVRDAAREEVLRGQVFTEMEPDNKTVH